MIKVSIIMPVYNAAEFLADAINSVLQQSFSEIELVAVNDGSTDQSAEILESFARKDSRLVILNQKNSGPSAARNNALQVARGEYVFFLDSDDLLEKKAIEHLYHKAETEQADLVIAKYDIYNGMSYIPVSNLDRIVSQNTINPYDATILWTFSLWNKLFRRSLIQDNNICFPPVSYSEDGVFTMHSVFRARKITGLNEVVMHYRRVTNAEVASITASVSESKIRDYLEAHKMIWNLIEQENVPKSYHYMFLYKEINILFTQFYRKFWDINEETVQLLAEEIRKLLLRLDVSHFLKLQTMHPEICFEDFPKNIPEMKKQLKVTIALYGDEEKVEAFLGVLRELESQSFAFMKICIPSHMHHFVEAGDCSRQNLEYIDCTSEKEFLKSFKEGMGTPYFMIASTECRYEPDAIRHQYLEASGKKLGSVTDFLHIHGNQKDRAPFTLFSVKEKGKRGLLNRKGKAAKALEKYSPYNVCMKFPISPFLPFLRKLPIRQKNYIFCYRPPYNIFSKLMLCYQCFTAREIQADHESLFLSVFPLKKKQKVLVKKTGQICLKNLTVNTEEVTGKLLKSPDKEKGLQRKLIQMIGHLPVQKKILFYSIRTDGKLDGNIQRIYEKTEGKKVVCAKRLPHDKKWKLRMYYEFATSKVIVVDDYARYLRLFPLKKSQRVVQLWHACGAFKKFGVDGTNLTPDLESSTHAQYNLVTVSAEDIREIYANAFQIGVDKVAALGVPRTDLYFDQAEMQAKREYLYKMHPEFVNRRIYLYAPTFRDLGADRTVFEPEINFDDLAKRLPENCIFVIAPHPIMKNNILKKNYDNILEIRDVSTGDLMFVSDLLITDYSSVIFEYSLLRKPIVFYCYDKAIYDRGFYLDYDHDLPGDIFTEYEAFVEYLAHPERQIMTGQYAKFVEKYMSACDGNSSARIADVINEYYKVKE